MIVILYDKGDKYEYKIMGDKEEIQDEINRMFESHPQEIFGTSVISDIEKNEHQEYEVIISRYANPK